MSTWACPHLSPQDWSIIQRAVRFAAKHANRDPNMRADLERLAVLAGEMRDLNVRRREKNLEAQRALRDRRAEAGRLGNGRVPTGKKASRARTIYPDPERCLVQACDLPLAEHARCARCTALVGNFHTHAAVNAEGLCPWCVTQQIALARIAAGRQRVTA